jgi:hypothetical protein
MNILSGARVNSDRVERGCAWRKGSRSQNTANTGCVEARHLGPGFQVRDSKLGDDSPVFRFRSEKTKSVQRMIYLVSAKTEGQNCDWRVDNAGECPQPFGVGKVQIDVAQRVCRRSIHDGIVKFRRLECRPDGPAARTGSQLGDR